VILLGGTLRWGAPDLEGALTEANLETLHADVAFIGADGIDRRGNIFNKLPGGWADASARWPLRPTRVFAVADSSKVGRSALMRLATSRSGWPDHRPQPSEITGRRAAAAGVRIISRTL